MEWRPFRRQIQRAIAIPVWATVPTAMGAIAWSQPVSRDDMETAISALTLAAAAFWVGLVTLAWVRRRPPFDQPAPPTSVYGDATVAILVGLALGAHAGLLRRADFWGAHGGAVTTHLLLLPTTLLVSIARPSFVRAVVDAASVMVGVEIGAQLGYSFAMGDGLRRFDDFTGMNAGYLGGAVAAALIWWTIQRIAPGVIRRPRIWHSRTDPDAPPPRKA